MSSREGTAMWYLFSRQASHENKPVSRTQLTPWTAVRARVDTVWQVCCNLSRRVRCCLVQVAKIRSPSRFRYFDRLAPVVQELRMGQWTTTAEVLAGLCVVLLLLLAVLLHVVVKLRRKLTHISVADGLQPREVYLQA